MRIKRYIPFDLIPSHWGLTAKGKEIARAKYYYTGKELDILLLDIDKDELEDKEYEEKLLEIQFKYHDITEREYKKQLADLNDDIYFEVIDASYKDNGDGTGRFEFELDWNGKFVLDLKDKGWKGITPEEIIDNWFVTVCNQMSKEDIEGIEYLPSPSLYPR